MASITTRSLTGSASGTGTITCTTSSTTVTGSGTLFTSESTVGKALFNSGGTFIGTINAINSNTNITLNTNAAVNVTTGAYNIGSYSITVKGTPLTNNEIDNNFLSLNNSKLETSWAGSSTLTILGTVATGTWSASTIAVDKGGTGQTVYTDGQLLIGNSTGNTLSKSTLTGTSNQITVTNGSGSITLSLPQSIATGSNVQFNSLGIGATPSSTSGEIRATNAITSYYSDERLKTNINLISNPLDKVMSLRGVTYEPNSIAESFGYTVEKMVGVLAQDVQRVLPEAVKPAPFDIMLYEGVEMSRSGQNYMTVQYEKLVPLLVEAIKELNKQVNELKGIK